MPCSEPRDPAYFQHLSNGERKGTFRNGHSRAHSVRTRHGLSDSHDFRIFSSMRFLGDPKRREAEFFTRGMMGRKPTASKKGRNGSLDTAPCHLPYPRELTKATRQGCLEASNEGTNNLSIKYRRQVHDDRSQSSHFGANLARPRLGATMAKVPEKELRFLLTAAHF